MQRPMPIIIPEYVERTFQLPGRTHYGREQPIYLFHDWPTPASRKAMKGLPMPAVGKTRELGCMVCLEDFEVGDKLRMMPCSHSFHQRCIFRWLRISRQCPCCRFRCPPAVDEEHSCWMTRQKLPMLTMKDSYLLLRRKQCLILNSKNCGCYVSWCSLRTFP